MKYIVSYSGGMGSFMAAEIMRQEGRDFDLVFCDTMTEDFDLYRFLNETADYFKKKVITITQNKNIWQLQTDEKFQANSQKDICSRLLKREPFKKWMRKNYKSTEATLVLGIGASEKHRTKDFQKNHKPFDVISPLTERVDINNDYIADYLLDLGIEPPRLYEYGFPHNNCGGFCVKSGQKQAALLLKHLPQQYAWHEDEQEAMFKELGFERPTIRKTIKGTQYYWSLKTFREFLQSGGTAEMWEEGNCACF